MDFRKIIAESSDIDFKEELETKKPKSWLKSVSAFANGFGGVLLFGIRDDHSIVGLKDIQADAENISRLIKERITSIPDFVLSPEIIDEKNILILRVLSGSGIKKIYDETAKLPGYRNEKKPVIRSNSDSFTVIFPNVNYTSDKSNVQKDVPKDVQKDFDLETEIIHLISENKTITISEIANRLEISYKTVQRAVDNLRKNGRISRHGGRRYRSWEIYE